MPYKLRFYLLSLFFFVLWVEGVRVEVKVEFEVRGLYYQASGLVILSLPRGPGFTGKLSKTLVYKFF